MNSSQVTWVIHRKLGSEGESGRGKDLEVKGTMVRHTETYGEFSLLYIIDKKVRTQ